MGFVSRVFGVKTGRIYIDNSDVQSDIEDDAWPDEELEDWNDEEDFYDSSTIEIRIPLFVDSDISERLDVPLDIVVGQAPTDVVVIDFETATSERASACALGLAFATPDGHIETRKWLIRPPGNSYDGFNISIHGIYPQDTERSPQLPEVWEEVHELVGNRSLVAHNAAFDMSVLRKSMAARGTQLPCEYSYLCTYRLAQRVWPDRVTYRLKDIARDLGLDTTQHHDPAWDAQAALEIANALAHASELATLTETAEKYGYRIGTLFPDPANWDPFSSSASDWKPSDLEATGEADQSHPFFDQCVVITGALPDGTVRKDAYQRIVDIGGRVASGVSKKVNVLVVVDLDSVLKDPASHTAKLKKAIDLAEAGVAIELMDANDFARLLYS